MTERDADRLEPLDRLAARVPELDFEQHEVQWATLPGDGHQARCSLNGGGIDGGAGTFFANAGEDVTAIGSLAPLIPGHIGCVVIRPDGSRYVARVQPDPLGGQRDS
jgi:hypothetical protein